MQESLASFHPVLQQWFEDTIDSPNSTLRKGGPKSVERHNVLLQHPPDRVRPWLPFLSVSGHPVQKLLSGNITEHQGVQILYVSSKSAKERYA